MKTFFTAITGLAFILIWSGEALASINTCGIPACPEGCAEGFTGQNSETTFRRTYVKHTRSQNHKTAGIAHTRSGDAAIITKSHFEDHLALDKNRIFKLIPLGNTIPMNVGVFDQFGDEAQVWNMPDLGQYNVIENFSIEHITPEESGFSDEFPEATHCYFMAHNNVYEFIEMAEDDLFVLGSVEVDGNDEGTIFDTYLTASPFPLELGLEFEGTVIIEYTEDPEIDSLIYTQEYIVSGYGTLNTDDDGPVDALKLNYTQTNVEYKDGQIIDSLFLREVVWYSVEGHYLRGSLIAGAPFEGQTTFAHMEYQRLDNSVNTVNVSASGVALNYFPNPISAGEVLTISNQENIHFGLVQLYDMLGRQVEEVDLSKMGMKQNIQIRIPSELDAGMYTYKAYSPSGKPIGQGNLVVR